MNTREKFPGSVDIDAISKRSGLDTDTIIHIQLHSRNQTLVEVTFTCVFIGIIISLCFGSFLGSSKLLPFFATVYLIGYFLSSAATLLPINSYKIYEGPIYNKPNFKAFLLFMHALVIPALVILIWYAFTDIEVWHDSVFRLSPIAFGIWSFFRKVFYSSTGLVPW